MDDSLGGEERTGRPAVIVSSNGLNSKQDTVTVVFVSKQGFASATRPSIADPMGGRQRVLCDQLRTVDKVRLTRYMHTLEESELIRVTGALASVMCIPLPRNESAKVEPKSDDELISLRCEADMWRRMYEKVMGQLAEIRVAADVSERTTPKEKPGVVEPDLGYEEETVVGEKKPEPPKKPEPKKKDEQVWDGIKMNLNIATPREMMERLGMSKSLAYKISAYRNKNGLFVSLEELLEVDRFTSNMFERFKDRITIEPVEETKKK